MRKVIFCISIRQKKISHEVQDPAGWWTKAVDFIEENSQEINKMWREFFSTIGTILKAFYFFLFWIDL